MARTVVGWLLAPALVIAACGPTVSPTPTVRAIAVTGNDLYLGFGSGAQFHATATLRDGTSMDVTTAAAWHSSSPSVATMDPAVPGLVKAVGYGAADISARYQGAAGSQSTSVLCGVFLLIAGSDITAPRTITLNAGTTSSIQTFVDFVTPMFEPIAANWSSSRPDIATVANDSTPGRFNGAVVTALSAGQTTLRATSGCASADLLVTVVAKS